MKETNLSRILIPNPQGTENFDSSSTFDCSEEGLKYIAGFLAHKFRQKYPELGCKTCESPNSGVSSSAWISSLSRGGLTLPSENFMKQILVFESIFKDIHGKNGLNSEYKVMETTVNQIQCKCNSVPIDVVRKYVRTRTFIRIKFLNQKLKEEKDAKRKNRRDLAKNRHFVT